MFTRLSIRKEPLKIAVLFGGLLLLVPVYYVYNPLKSTLFPPCPFHWMTGFYCPGCGTQRAIHALLHGQLLQAASFNLLAMLALPFILYSGWVLFANTVLQKQYSQNLFYKPWFSKLVLVLVVLFGILRNLPFSFFHWMAP